MFHACFEANTDAHGESLLRWKRNTVTWDTHCPRPPSPSQRTRSRQFGDDSRRNAARCQHTRSQRNAQRLVRIRTHRARKRDEDARDVLRSIIRSTEFSVCVYGVVCKVVGVRMVKAHRHLTFCCMDRRTGRSLNRTNKKGGNKAKQVMEWYGRKPFEDDSFTWYFDNTRENKLMSVYRDR